MTSPKKTIRPKNQKEVYSSFSDLYEKIMNDEVSIEKAEVAVQALSGMNRTMAIEIKITELKKKPSFDSVK
jgi:hypothetical protein